MRKRRDARRTTARSNDVERLLRSSRAGERIPWMPSDLADRRVDEAAHEVASLLADAHRLLAPYRDSQTLPDLQQAYAAVHAARGELAAVRHWRAVSLMLARAQAGAE